MKTLIRNVTLSIVTMSVAGWLGAGQAYAESEERELVGTWALVSATTTKDGKKEDYFGSSPQGRVVFDAQGNYVLTLMRSDMPDFAANNRSKGSVEENTAVVLGSISHFGTYSCDEKSNTCTLDIKSSTFPNWNGTRQTRRLTVKGDELQWVIAAASSGKGQLEMTLKRLK